MNEKEDLSAMNLILRAMERFSLSPFIKITKHFNQIKNNISKLHSYVDFDH